MSTSVRCCRFTRFSSFSLMVTYDALNVDVVDASEIKFPCGGSSHVADTVYRLVHSCRKPQTIHDTEVKTTASSPQCSIPPPRLCNPAGRAIADQSSAKLCYQFAYFFSAAISCLSVYFNTIASHILDLSNVSRQRLRDSPSS